VPTALVYYDIIMGLISCLLLLFFIFHKRSHETAVQFE